MSNKDGEGDKRTVTTDALASLGTIIGDKEKRDAIHLAVEPVIAGTYLAPGQHIEVKDGVAWPTRVGKGLGIVDPFLEQGPDKGQRFWFVMYPRMVHSLRHVWTHPSFADEVGTPKAEPPKPEGWRDEHLSKIKSEQWLRAFCEKEDCPQYETVMAAIVEGEGRGHLDESYLHFENRDAHGEIPSEFWDHVEIVTGRKFPRAKYFSCSC